MIWISRRSLHSLSEPGILRENFLPSPTSECTLGKPFNSETLRNLKLFSKNISTFATLRESNRTKEPWQKTFLQKRLGTAKGTIFSLFLLLVSSEVIFFLTLSWKWVIFDILIKITKNQNMRARNFNFCISQFSDQTWAKIFAALRFEMWFFVFGFAKLPMPIKSNQIVLQPNSIPEGEAIKGSWTKWQKYL